MSKKTVAFCFGGNSTEHEVSCRSAAWVVENADNEKYNVIKIGISKEGEWLLYSSTTDRMRDGSWLEDTENLKSCAIIPSASKKGIFVFESGETIVLDAVFPVLHGKNGEDGTIQGLLAMAGIPCVGSNTYSSAVCMNKNTSKLLVRAENIVATADWICVKKGEYRPEEIKRQTLEILKLPVFVKPACAGSSVGVVKVKKIEELETALKEALKHDSRALVEKAIAGREIEVAALKVAGGQTYVSRCGEIDPGAEFYDYVTKYENDTAVSYIPARISPETAEKVRAAAERIYSLLDCAGPARVDFFVTDKNEVIFNEINTMPGMTAISLYPQLMEDIGMGGSSLVELMIESAVLR